MSLFGRFRSRVERMMMPRTVKRQWEAAKVKLQTMGWLRNVRPIDHDIRYGLWELRGRARQLAQNNDHVAHFLQLVRTNIVGPRGIQLQARAKLKNGKLDERSNDALEDGWREWCKRGNCDVTGQISFVTLLQQAIESIARDGEVIVRKIKGWKKNRFYFALQMIDPETLDVRYNERLPNGNVVVMGVELDKWRRPVAYHLIPDIISVNFYGINMGERVRVPADEIYHVYLPRWVWQTRGVPWFSESMGRLYMLGGYEDAEVTAARVGASKMGFYQMDLDAAAELARNMLGGTPGDGAANDGQTSSGELTQEASPGEFEILPPGYTFQEWNPAHPNTAFGDFSKNMLRAIGGGLGVSYHKFANDPKDVNYSTGRIFELDEREHWKSIQEWFVDSLVGPVYDDWLESALLVEALRGRGRPLDLMRIDDFRRVRWQPRRWPWLDPLKEMQANERAVNLRLKSISGIIREQGDDPEEVWEELERDMQVLDEKGLAPLSSKKASMPSAPETDPDGAGETPQDTATEDQGKNSDSEDESNAES